MEQTQEQDNLFESDGLVIFEKLLHGYRKSKQSIIWKDNIDNLVEKLTHLPTDPFSVRLMQLFDYDYLILEENIEILIQKALLIREQMKHTQRSVTINERYFSLPFLPGNTHLKSLEIFNDEGELCYLLKGRWRVNWGNLFYYLFPYSKKVLRRDIIHFRQKILHNKKIEIFYYSPYVDLKTTDTEAYYNFFCDYHGKIQFIKYIQSKDSIPPTTMLQHTQKRQSLASVLNLTSSQQVLWGYFLFRLMGLKLRVNVELSVLTRFLHLLNNINIDDYKNSYFYKLVSKAPYVKEDKNLLRDLETIRIHFQQNNLPTGDIEKEILNLISND